MTWRNGELGVGVIELSLVVLGAFFFIFVSIDFVRYIQIKAALTKGAQDGVRLSARLKDAQIPPSDFTNAAKLAQFQAARDEVIKRSLEYPRSAGLKVASAANGIVSYTPASANDAPAAGDLLAAFLRPGETYQTADGKTVDHPTLPGSSAISGYDTILATHPFIVELRYRLPTFMLLGQRTISVRAESFPEFYKPMTGTTVPRTYSLPVGPPIPPAPGPAPPPVAPVCPLTLAGCQAINAFMVLQKVTCSCICIFPFTRDGDSCLILGGG